MRIITVKRIHATLKTVSKTSKDFIKDDRALKVIALFVYEAHKRHGTKINKSILIMLLESCSIVSNKDYKLENYPSNEYCEITFTPKESYKLFYCFKH